MIDPYQYTYMQALWSPVDAVQGVFCEAKAGTGKTTLAVLAGVYEVEKGQYDRIIYIRNTLPLRDMGHLPGSADEKVYPFMQPLIGAMDDIQPGMFVKWSRQDLKEPPKVELLTTAFIRGLTWKNSFVIIDEAQSFDLVELQTAFTRCDDSCKVVCIGSLRQNDNRKLIRYSGLTPFEVFMEHFRGTRVTYHKLEKNYRGWLASHADDVIETVEKLRLGVS